MDYNKLRIRINRKLGAEVLFDKDILKLWYMADKFLEDFNINLNESEKERFKKRWITCKVKQMSEYWTSLVLDYFLDFYKLKVDFNDLKKQGIEEELKLVNLLNEEKKLDL